MTIHYQDELVTLHHADCRDVLAGMADDSVHAIVTDPPYELGFMGKSWDSSGIAYDVAMWAECLRVLKPGGHLLSFGAARTFHRMAVAVEDAGFEIRDSIAWLYGQGFPKSLDVGKATGEAAGAKAWEGWGTALKPAFEPILVARKPFLTTVAANVLAHGTGALSIDATRTGRGAGARWPTNVILDESQAATLDGQTGVLTSGANPTKRGSDKFRTAYGDFKGQTNIEPARGADSGGASRFFPTFRYEAKAPSSERPNVDGVQHATVKPLDLMRWLVRLVTPPGGIVFEPFAGSGTTAEAALLEGFNVIAVEKEADHLPLIMQRISKPLQQSLFGDL